MGMPHMLQRLSPKINKKNGFLILILVGLVVAAEFVEKDFMCPCEEILRWVFFVFYLFIPAFITLTVTYCIMCELYKEDFGGQKSGVENEGQKTTEEGRKPKSSDIEETEHEQSNEADGPRNWRFRAKCCIPSVVWIILFFSDGRFVACVFTQLMEGYADSNPHPPWEWCDRNRTLTGAQQRAEKAYKYSKVVGFGFLFFVSVVILVYKCCIVHKARHQQKQDQTAVKGEELPLRGRTKRDES